MKKSKYLYLCNALDDLTKSERNISTDSPAASNKVFSLCRALLGVGANISVLSMGRGRQDGTTVWHRHFSRDYLGVSVCYATFWNISILTHLVTAFSLMYLLLKDIFKYKVVLIAYNRQWHFVPTLLMAYLLRVPCFLDLEDGYIGVQKGFRERTLVFTFEKTCNQGTLLACSALHDQVKSSHQLVCYGVAESVTHVQDWQTPKLQVLFGGSLCIDTGAQLFIDAVMLLINQKPELVKHLHFVVTGKGNMADEIAAFANGNAKKWLRFHPSVANTEYQKILAKSHIGLCLKLPSSVYHHTTFPSKVIELTAHGLLLVSTSVSDVPKIFSKDEVLFLQDESPENLSDTFEWLAMHRREASQISKRGSNAVMRCCSTQNVGHSLRKFLTKSPMQ